MSDESSNAPSEHSDDSFDIFPDDASTDHLVHVPTPNGMDRIVEKLPEVLSGTTEILAKNQVMLSNIAQIAEAVSKDKERGTAGGPYEGQRRQGPPHGRVDDDLGRKCPAVESLEKAVEEARYEMHLLKFGEQEANRRMAEMSKKIQMLEELQVDTSRKISELEMIVEDERDKVEVLEDWADDQDEVQAALTQKVQKLMTLHEKNTNEKNRKRAGDAPALVVAEGQYEKKNHTKSKKQAETKHSKKIDPAVCGRTVSLLAYNGFYLCGNYGNTPATTTGSGANWEPVQFIVEKAGNGMVALKSCGKYLTIAEDGRTVACSRRSRNKWSHFDWIEHSSGEISLRGANGKYVSSEDGFSFGEYVTCNRDKAEPLERFTVV
ncbi:hypothetical protein AAVH_22280 [Aphelenchoides avenae]|nr:hypothetical protein AAVH_22280 [Aphelenchus avenae]